MVYHTKIVQIYWKKSIEKFRILLNLWLRIGTKYSEKQTDRELSRSPSTLKIVWAMHVADVLVFIHYLSTKASEYFTETSSLLNKQTRQTRAPGALVEYSWEKNTNHLFIALPQFHGHNLDSSGFRFCAFVKNYPCQICSQCLMLKLILMITWEYEAYRSQYLKHNTWNPEK